MSRDQTAVEEPLEIRVAAGAPLARSRPVAVTMRTPGEPDDFELAVGFLHAEGVIATGHDVAHATYCLEPDLAAEQRHNVVTVTLREGLDFDVTRLERHVTASSACGVCGKERLEQLELRGIKALPSGPLLDPQVLYELPRRMWDAQKVFHDTGGLHAAAIFDATGRTMVLREDVGRHNAVDKLVGEALLDQRLPLADTVMLVSGRAGFEIVQKALAAGVPVVASLSAPSSLAVATATRFGMTLIGFLRGKSANVYSGAERLGL